MRLATGLVEATRRLLVIENEQCADVSECAEDWPVILAEGTAGRQRLASVCQQAQRFPLGQIQWCPPITSPRKIFAVGRNYAEHVQELSSEVPAEPLIFNILPTALIGNEAEIRLPSLSDQIDYEAELVVVIGQGGQGIARSRALSHVAGYTCGNDITARDWQKHKPGGQWLLGKSFDTFAPTGPCLVTADEVPSPQELDISLRLNGQTMQDANTRDQIFPIDFLISYISQVATLEPGDLIFTGTPGGVGSARKPQVFLKAGDVVEVEIAGVGCLRNSVVSAR